MFTLVNNQWTIDPQYLSVIPIRKVWDRDTDPNKLVAKAQIGWLYHMYHPKSIYRDVRDSLRDVSIRQDTFPKHAISWDADVDDDIKSCIEWYKNKLKDTPIWDSVRSIEQGIYQLNDIIRDPQASAYEKKSALETVSDVVQPKLKKLKEQAERDEIIDIQIKVVKDIKYGERVENADRGKIKPPGAKYNNATPEGHDFNADLAPPIPSAE